MAYAMLPQINPSSRQWIVCVRVSRRWHYRKGTDDGPIDHTDLVLLDEQGNHMYAEISLHNVAQFKPLLEEEKVYEIRKFIVAASKKAFKPVEAPFMIWFTKHTVVEEKITVPDSFPMWTYNPVPFAEIPRPTANPEYFVDVIGFVAAISDIEHIHTASRPTPSIKRTVLIRDSSDHEIRLDMWGECATRFDKQNIQAVSETEHVVAIFVGTLPKIFKGQISLSGSSACRWYINADVPEINALRASKQEQFKPLQTIAPSMYGISTSALRPPVEEKTVRELLDLDIFDCEGTNYSCTVTVTRLSQGQRWWFPSCQLCHKSAIPDGAFYRCSDPNCASTHADPKYRISLIGSDGNDEAEFVLFGKIGHQIVRKPILTLLRVDHPVHEPLHEIIAAARTRDVIPNDIAAIVSQKYTFVVSVTDKSFLRPQPSFQVHRVDTVLGKQLHSSLFYTSPSSSHLSTTKDKSLIQEISPSIDSELGPSSATHATTRIPESLSQLSQYPIALQNTPFSMTKQTTTSSTSASGDTLPVSQRVRRNLLADQPSAEHTNDPEFLHKGHTPQQSQPIKGDIIAEKSTQPLPLKRSARVAGHPAIDPPAWKRSTLPKTDKE